jgi:alpha-beta hydrolase superfamily lysophospholipase
LARVLFLHGWNSIPGGAKPTYLAGHGHTVLNPALPDDDFAEAVRIAQAEFDKHCPGVVVGSSRGGAVAMNIRAAGAALVLLCPAWKKWGTATTIKPGTLILHSEDDDVIPMADSRELLFRSGLPEACLIVVGNDHRLADSEPLDALLAAIESVCRCDTSILMDGAEVGTTLKKR